MKTKITITMLAIAGIMAVPAWGGGTTDLLESYEAVSTALANDDLASAKTAASDLAEKANSADQETIAEHADALGKSASLDDAREHFKAVSAEAVGLAEHTEGFHVIKCPMAEAKWVQSGDKIMNPYMGKKMQQCGEKMKMMKGTMGGIEGGCIKCCSMMG